MKVKQIFSNFKLKESRRNVHFWLRSEVKDDEQRTLLLPNHVNQLVKAGIKVTVEECPQRCIPITDYKDCDCDIAPAGSWSTKAPKDAIIVGLKELPDDDFPLVHSHIYFAHIFKGQFDAPKLFDRFHRGGGQLYDLEYLVDDTGRRVAAFGASAGMAGAAIGALVWAYRKAGKTGVFPAVNSFPTYSELIAHVKDKLNGNSPRAIIVGSSGRVGGGAAQMLKGVGIEFDTWNTDKTKGKKGPFLELLEYDIFINAILFHETDEFIFLEKKNLIDSKGSSTRKLDTVVDISCDVNNPKNPLPLYENLTYFKEPSKRLVEEGVDVIQIDHLPSLVPYESSGDFTGQLMPHLLEFAKTPVWQRSLDLFNDKKKLYVNIE